MGYTLHRHVIVMIKCIWDINLIITLINYLEHEYENKDHVCMSNFNTEYNVLFDT